jgi:phenylalanyl-tRNA synthetase beta chain
VDITNFILHETGQPLHAFDAQEITGGKVVVKKLPAGSKFVTLDGTERELSGSDLMICNTEEGMCIGGVFGGIKSGVTEKTKNIFIESAYFDSVHIRKSSKYHDLQTDASFRFERGVDPDMTIYALKRATLLVKEVAGGTISSQIRDVYPQPIQKAKIKVNWQHIDRLIGKSIGKDVIRNILNSLQFVVINEDAGSLQLEVPSCRVDVTREADVIEEILRIFGYNRVEIPLRQNSSVSHAVKPDPENIQNLVSDFLVSNGFVEIMNNSLTRSSYYESNPDYNFPEIVEILNPLSRDLNVMRPGLLFGALESVIYNLNRKNEDLKLFEFGTVYSLTEDKNIKSEVTRKFREQNHLALLVTGRQEKESWYTTDKSVDLSYLKSVVTAVLKRTGINLSIFQHQLSDKSYYSEGISYFYNNDKIIECGMVSKEMLQKFDIKQDVFYASLNWDQVFSLIRKRRVQYSGIPKFPEVRRDLSLLINREVAYAEIEKLAFETGGKLLQRVNLFDVYEGKNIEPGKKSYALSFTLQDEEKTLTDKVIEHTMARLMKVFEDKLNAKIR